MLRPLIKGALVIGVLCAALVTATAAAAHAVFPMLPIPDWEIVTFTAFHRGDITRHQSYFADTRLGIAFKTADPSYDALSPDGTRVAYVRGHFSSGTDIIVQNLDSRTQINATQSNSRRIINVLPVWSPDGRKIAFRRALRSGKVSYGVFVIDLTTRITRQYTESGVIADRVSWSPDGGWIAFTAGVKTTSTGIHLLEITSGTITQLTDFGHSPLWSRDGRQIVFLDRDSWQVYAVNTDGTNLHALLTLPRVRPDYYVVWQG